MVWTRFFTRRRVNPTPSRSERGATLSEYALLGSLVVVASIGAISLLEDGSGSYLADTGDDIGTPREFAADIDPDLPEEPDWLTPPPPPTTTTLPPAAPVYQGPIRRIDHPTLCHTFEALGATNTATVRVPCDASTAQNLELFGTTTVIDEITWADNPGYCLSSFISPASRVLFKPCDGSDSQRWDVTDNGGNVTFTSRDQPTQCLRSHDSGLRLEGCSNHDRVKFFIP